MDAVVSWLDTTDKDYIEQKNKDFNGQETYDSKRIGKRDELRFVLRSLYYNLPWLRKIYLLTWDKQFPKWLDEEKCAKLSPPIIKIKRESFNNGKYIYGTSSLEMLLDKIPGLSDLFIYSNSDTFILKPMKQSDWIDKQGLGKLRTTDYLHSFKPESCNHKNYDILLQVGLFLEKFGKPKFPFFSPNHQITILSKEAYNDVRIAYPKLYDITINMKGREYKERISRLFLEYMAVYNGYCKVKFDTHSENISNTKHYSNIVLKKDTQLLCTNLNSTFPEDQYSTYMSFMVRLFPKPHPAEKYLSYENICYYRYQKQGCPSMCAKMPLQSITENDSLPIDNTFNIIKRIPYLLKTRKKRSLGSKQTRKR